MELHRLRTRPAAAPRSPVADDSKPRETPQAPRQRAGEVPLAELPKHLPEYVVKEADVKADQLSLATGERLTLAVKAADLCDFVAGPNVGSGETWQLDVVSMDELLTRLEAQELLVKQRFEAIIEEMTETRNLLLRMDFTPPGMDAAAPPKARSAGSDPGDAPEKTLNLTAEELSKRRLERTLQALQNCRKNHAETADVIAAIEEIRLQLENNQVDDEKHKKRIEKRVLQPLHEIVDGMFPLLDKELMDLKEVVDNLSTGPKARDAAQKQADLILAKMQVVLNDMMKAEDFQREVVERLKKIIQKQQELMKQTEKTEQESLGEKE